MPNCPACHHEVDEQALAAGRCAECGARLHQPPRRTVHDVVAPSESQSEEPPPGLLSEHPTLELPIEPASTDADNLQTIDLSVEEGAGIESDAPPQKPPTVEFTGEQTVDFTGLEDDEQSTNLVTSQWENHLDDDEVGTNCTIKQKETIAGPFVTRSSVVVKSRQVKQHADVTEPAELSAEDAPDYELLEIIGEGGMGVVYAAKQSAIARTVAVKMLKGDDAKVADQYEKFISEAVITGELDHPNIVPIYDLGANAQGALFYSMKRVRGTPWNKIIKEKSLDENLNILLRTADAVAFAHANGVVHRDLKPENIMLGDYGEVLVMDWGLARIGSDFPNAKAVIQSDVMGGTPAYMAPEMATGPVEKITAASDTYLLGAILFEIITGRPPHSGSTVMACLFAAAKNKIAKTEHSGELFDVALQAMATKTEDRYPSVREFQEAIRLFLSHSESILITDSAEKNLAAARDDNDYELYSRAFYGLEEALSLWEGNARARQMLVSTRLAYAGSALDKGDFDLGISLLDPDDAQQNQLLEQLVTRRRERESRQKRLQIFKALAALLLLTVVGVITVAYMAVSKQRDRAVSAEGVARQAEGEARQAEGEARSAEKEAQSNFERAERERLRAEREKDRAEQAKRAEQYEAYVARIGLAKAKIEENSFARAKELLQQCSPDLSHWEWGRLAYLCQLSKRSWQLDGPVDALAVSPDGQHFVSGDRDGKARLWDMGSGQSLHTIAQGQYVQAVAFDQQGKRFAAGSSDGLIGIYRVADGKLLRTLSGHEDGVLSVCFSQDGRSLLSSGYDNTARLWDLETGETQQQLRGHTWWVWAARFSPDDQRIVTAGQDGKAIVWQRTAGATPHYEEFTEFTKHDGPVYAARFSPDGRQIATGGYDQRILLWNPDEVQPVDIGRRLERLPDPPAPYQELLGHTGPVRALAFSPVGQTLASGGRDNLLRIWKIPTGELIRTLRGHASHVRSCEFSPDGELLLSAGRDQQIKLWDPQTYAESIVLGEETAVADAILAARFSRDGSRIVSASRDRTAVLWDVAGRRVTGRFQEGHDFLASSAVFSTDGTRMATGAGDGTVRIWDVATGTEISQLSQTGWTSALDLSDDGRWIVTGSSGNDAVVWDTLSGQRVATLSGHEAVVSSVRFAPGGAMIATGDDRGRCRLWVRQDQPDQWHGSHWLQGHSRSITAMAFVDQGRRLVTSSGDNTCGQWDVTTGSEISELVLKHPDWVAGMEVSDDGRRALTCCDDGALRLWALADARLLWIFQPEDEAEKDESEKKVVFTSVDLSPDGQQVLAACAANSTVQSWNLHTESNVNATDAEQPTTLLDFGHRGGIVWAARFSPDGSNVLTIGGNDARLWDAKTRAPIVRFSPHGAVASADISPDGRLLVTGSWDRSAKIWDIASGKAVRRLDGVHQGFVNSVEFSPDGETILSASDDGTARLWEVTTGEPLDVVFSGHEARVRQARFSADGRRVLTVANDKTARLWNAQTGGTEKTLSGHQWAVLCGEFSRDGRRVITGSEDNKAIIWDAQSGEVLLELAGHTGSITSVAFSPSGSRVVTGSQDSTAKLWDALTGKEIMTLSGHDGELTSVGFSPDGRQVLTSGHDGQIVLWPAVDWQAPRFSPAEPASGASILPAQ